MATLPQNVLDLLASGEVASEVAESVASILGWTVAHGDGWSAAVSPDGMREIRGTVVDAVTTTWSDRIPADVALARSATGAATNDDVLAARIVQRLLSLDGMRCTIDTDPDSTYPESAWAGDLARAVASEIRAFRSTVGGAS